MNSNSSITFQFKIEFRKIILQACSPDCQYGIWKSRLSFIGIAMEAWRMTLQAEFHGVTLYNL